MTVYTPPPPAQPKKKGLGCFGCGCVVLLLLGVLTVGLTGALAYVIHSRLMEITSDTPANIATFDGGDEMYATAKQKLADFNHDQQSHQPATLQLSADEINTLIARPRFCENEDSSFCVDGQ